MTTDEQGRIRIRLKGLNGGIPELGWATSAPGNEFERAGGYTVEWDDGYKDEELTRWYFDNDDMFDLEYA